MSATIYPTLCCPKTGGYWQFHEWSIRKPVTCRRCKIPLQSVVDAPQEKRKDGVVAQAAGPKKAVIELASENP